MKTITFTHNGFHGYNEITIRPLAVRPVGVDVWGDPTDAVIAYVSAATARRIAKVVCGVAGCSCGEHAGHQDYPGEGAEIYIDGDEVRGNYPQS